MTRHLSSVPTPPTQIRRVEASLRFALMAARKHAESGDLAAFVTAIGDVVWVQHTGRHEQISDREMVAELAAIGAAFGTGGAA